MNEIEFSFWQGNWILLQLIYTSSDNNANKCDLNYNNNLNLLKLNNLKMKMPWEKHPLFQLPKRWNRYPLKTRKSNNEFRRKTRVFNWWEPWTSSASSSLSCTTATVPANFQRKILPWDSDEFESRPTGKEENSSSSSSSKGGIRKGESDEANSADIENDDLLTLYWNGQRSPIQQSSSETMHNCSCYIHWPSP